MTNGRLKIYLGDLTHTTLVLASDFIPLNIGFIATYAQQMFGREVEIQLFKYPEHILSAMKEEMPHLIGLSNYPWCSSLSLEILKFAKQQSSCRPVTILGGSSYPSHEKGQEVYLKERPAADFYVYLEGERSFCHLIERFMSCGGVVEKMQQAPIVGCHFYSTPSCVLVKGELPERIKNLDDIPSPYLTGVLDPFFDTQLTPMVQTNRGCPFTCTFCHEGRDYFNKLYSFGLDRIREELLYIGERCRGSRIKTLQLSDSNFGMYAQDYDICQTIRQIRGKTGWPLKIATTTGKNRHERILRSIEAIGGGVTMSMSVQSMDTEVLKNIRRANIRLDTYIQIHEDLKRHAQRSFAEVILCLPGETRASHLGGIKTLIDAEVKSIQTYTLMLLDGTELNTPAIREKYGLRGKFRILPRDFGVYDGILSIEVEEVAVESNTLSFEDYLYLRGFHLMLTFYYNNEYFIELVEYLIQKGLSPHDWMTKMYSQISSVAPSAVQEVTSRFLRNAQDELWDTSQAVWDHYANPENYRKLLTGEAGGNLLYNTCGKIFISHFESFLDYGVSMAVEMLLIRMTSFEEKEELRRQMGDIRQFIWHKLSDLFSVQASATPLVGFQYDILAWKDDLMMRPLEAYALPPDRPCFYVFVRTSRQRQILEEAIACYGSTPVGLGIILSRAVTIQELFKNPTRMPLVEAVAH